MIRTNFQWVLYFNYYTHRRVKNIYRNTTEKDTLV